MDFFNTLNKVDCSGKIEKKNGLSYLSWAWAWTELKKRYPYSYYTIYETPEGGLVWRDPVGGHVKTGVTVVEEVDGVRKELECIEYLPIMDFKNKAIPYENITSMDANKAIQRSLTKSIARGGLGLFVYAGEDLPEEDVSTNIDLIRDIDTIIASIVKSMSKEDKESLVNNIIVPITGMKNYKVCKDTEKLTMLLEKLKGMQK